MPQGFLIATTGLERVKKRIGRIPPSLNQSINEAVEYAVRTYEKEAKRLASGKLLKVRTGRYRSSIKGRVKGGIGIVGSSIIYARIQEKGGVVRPKRAKYLAVPLPHAKTKSGVAKPPRSYRDTFVRRSRRGNLIIFQQRGRNIVPLFVLKKRVRLKGRFVFKTAKENKKQQVNRYFNKKVATIITGH